MPGKKSEQFLYTLAPYERGTKVSIDGIQQTIVGVVETQVGFTTRLKQVVTSYLNLTDVHFDGQSSYVAKFEPRWDFHDPIDTLVIVEG